MSAWLSFLGGYAKGANEEIDKQREKEEQYIQDRMKMAAATRLQKEKEAETQRKELMEAKGTLQAYPGFANANPAQQIALLADPTIREKFITKSKNGEVFDIDKELDINYERLKQYKTVNDYVQSVRAKPKAVDEQTMSAFNTPKRVFGAVVGTDAEGLKQNAARFNMTPEEFGGWSQGGEEVTPETGFASFKQEALAPQDIEGQQQLLETQALAAQRDLASSDPTVVEKAKTTLTEVKTKAAGLLSLKRMIEGGPDIVKWQDEMNRVMLGIANATNPEERKALEARKVELERIERLGKKEPKGDTPDAMKPATFATLRTAANDAMIRAIKEAHGEDALKGLVIEKNADGSSTIFFNKLDKNVQDKVRATGMTAAAGVFAPYVKDGVPTTEAARLAMAATGVTPTVAPVVTPPPKPQPAVTPPANPAAGGTTGQKTITMREIVDIEEYQRQNLPPEKRKTAAQLVAMYKQAKDAKGAPLYKVVP